MTCPGQSRGKNSRAGKAFSRVQQQKAVGGRNTNTHTHTHHHQNSCEQRPLCLQQKVTIAPPSTHTHSKWWPLHMCSDFSRWMCVSSYLPYLLLASYCVFFWGGEGSAEHRSSVLTGTVCVCSARDDIYLPPQVPTFLWWQSIWNLSEDPGRKTGVPTPSGFLCQVSSTHKDGVRLHI